jgi:hypothetical protein
MVERRLATIKLGQLTELDSRHSSSPSRLLRGRQRCAGC